MRIEDDALTGLYFVGQKYFPPVAIVTDADAAAMSPLARKVAEEVAEYFTGMRETFSVPIHLRGTAFQRRVWKELLAIPFGELVTYGDITERVGLPMSGARAVGGAVGRNPVSIMVPCHRVVGASGSLTGYAGGIDRKRALLSLEGAGSSAAPTIRCNRRSRSERKCATASCVQHGPARFTFRIRAGRHVEFRLEQRDERRRRVVAQLRGHRADRLARIEQRQRRQQPHRLPPFGKRQPRVLPEQPRQRASRRADLMAPFVEIARIARIACSARAIFSRRGSRGSGTVSGACRMRAIRSAIRQTSAPSGPVSS